MGAGTYNAMIARSSIGGGIGDGSRSHDEEERELHGVDLCLYLQERVS